MFETELAGRHAVVKVSTSAPGVPGVDLDAELAGMTAARAAGVPVPEVLVRHRGDPAVLVLAYASGNELATTSPDAHWRAVARELRRLHDGAPTQGIRPFGNNSDWWPWMRWWTAYTCDRAAGERLLPAGTVDPLRTVLEAAFAEPPAIRPRLLHGDCTPEHWLLRDGRVIAALDFGDCGQGDPAYDLATLTLWDQDRVDVVLDGYATGERTAEHVRRMLFPYQVIRHLAALAWLVDHGFDPTPTAEQMARIAAAYG